MGYVHLTIRIPYDELKGAMTIPFDAKPSNGQCFDHGTHITGATLPTPQDMRIGHIKRAKITEVTPLSWQSFTYSLDPNPEAVEQLTKRVNSTRENPLHI